MKLLSSALWIVGVLFCSGVWCSIVQADLPLSNHAYSISIQGRSEVVVAEPVVRLADIAQIDSVRIEDDEQIGRLKRIEVATSPKAGDSSRIEGTTVIERIRNAGISVDTLRYTLPREITVTRAFREVGLKELEGALASFLGKSGRQIEVKRLVIEKPVRIPTDSMGIEVVALKTTQPGHIGVDYRSVEGLEEARFQLRALADEWRLMPVAMKPLKRGAVVEAGDVQLSKVGDIAIRRDSVENIGDVIGYSISSDIGQGEMFRASALQVPPAITAGTRITLLVRTGRLEVTATGVALESGIIGQDIKVRNESSKKIITGKIEQAGLVVVGAY